MKNNYEILGDVTRIYFRNCNDSMLIDTEDFEKVSMFTWYKDSYGYANTSNHKRCHNIVMGDAPKGLVTDHINRNKLDNRKSNLRFATPSENVLNRDYFFDKSLKKVGIRYRKGKRFESYYVEIKDDNNATIYIGSYHDLGVAETVRCKAKKLYLKGELTPLEIKKLRNAQ